MGVFVLVLVVGGLKFVDYVIQVSKVVDYIDSYSVDLMKGDLGLELDGVLVLIFVGKIDVEFFGMIKKDIKVKGVVVLYF